MLWTLASWLYITILCLSFGFATKRFMQTIPTILLPLLGLAQLTLLTTILSLFLPLNAYVHGGILAAAMLYLVCDYRFVKQCLAQLMPALTALPKSTWLIIGGLAIVLASFASFPAGFFPYDTALYHAQAVQWIQAYKAVPGLANFHPQLGFNSSWFVITALFADLVHSLNGWLIFWCVLFFGWSAFGKNQPAVSSAVSLASLAVLAMLAVFYMHPNQVTTASTDMPAALWLLLSVVLFVQYAEHSRSPAHAWLVPVLTITVLVAITTKLSNAPVGLLLTYVLYQLLRQKNYRLIISQMLAGILVLVPWIIRNVILSGYVVYPVTVGGELLANLDWQVPLMDVLNMQQCITEWAKHKSCAISTTPWLPQWLTELRRSTLLADSKLLIAISVGYGLIAFTHWRQAIRFSWSALWPVYAIAVLGLGFWFYSAPDVRFGLGFISLALVLWLLPVSLVVLKAVAANRSLGMLATLALILVLAGGEYPLTTLSGKNLLTPASYPVVETAAAQLGDYTVYDSEHSSYACWDTFPCTSKLNAIELRGPELQDGFRKR